MPGNNNKMVVKTGKMQQKAGKDASKEQHDRDEYRDSSIPVQPNDLCGIISYNIGNNTMVQNNTPHQRSLSPFVLERLNSMLFDDAKSTVGESRCGSTLSTASIGSSTPGTSKDGLCPTDHLVPNIRIEQIPVTGISKEDFYATSRSVPKTKEEQFFSADHSVLSTSQEELFPTDQSLVSKEKFFPDDNSLPSNRKGKLLPAVTVDTIPLCSGIHTNQVDASTSNKKHNSETANQFSDQSSGHLFPPVYSVENPPSEGEGAVENDGTDNNQKNKKHKRLPCLAIGSVVGLVALMLSVGLTIAFMPEAESVKPATTTVIYTPPTTPEIQPVITPTDIPENNYTHPSCARDVVIVFDSSANMSRYIEENSNTVANFLDNFRLGPPNMTAFTLYIKDMTTFYFKDFNSKYHGGSNVDISVSLTFTIGGKSILTYILDEVRTSVLPGMRRGVQPIVLLFWDGSVSLENEASILSQHARLITVAPEQPDKYINTYSSTSIDMFTMSPELPQKLIPLMCDSYKTKTICAKDVVVLIDISLNIQKSYISRIRSEVLNIVENYKIGQSSMLISLILIDSQTNKGGVLWDLKADETIADIKLFNGLSKVLNMRNFDAVMKDSLHDVMTNISDPVFISGRDSVSNVLIVYWDGVQPSLLGELQGFYQQHQNTIRLVSVTPNKTNSLETITASPYDRFYFYQAKPSYTSDTLCGKYPRNCPELQSPTHGTLQVSSYTFRGQATYDCYTGYNLHGEQMRTCQLDGQWTGVDSQCIIVDCGVPAPLQFGVTTYTVTTYGGETEYRCNPGYTMSGSNRQMCLANGTWSDSPPTCIAVDCGHLTHPAFGTVHVNLTTYRHIVTYTCNKGYTLRGFKQRKCQVDATWSESAPTCQIVKCQNLTIPENGRISFTSVTYQSEVTYYCNTGYEINGPNKRLCLETGLWSGSQSTCKPVSCSPLVASEYSTISSDKNTFGGTTTYICSYGYKMTGTSQRSCLADGTWSGIEPTCTAVPCGNFISITYTAHCHTGYEQLGSGTKICLANGTWVGDEATCVPVSCGSLPGIQFGSVTTNRITYKGTTTYTCTTGYRLVGQTHRTCGADKLWSGTQPICQIIDCGTVPYVANSVHTNDKTTYAGIVRYTCNTGHILDGSQMRSCQLDGRWSGTVTECRVINCGPLSQISNGGVTWDKRTYGGLATYNCNEGFIVNGNEQRICQQSWSGSQPYCEDCARKSFDLVFVMDASGSVGQPNFDVMKKFVANIVKTLYIEPYKVNVGIVRFDDSSKNIFHLNKYDAQAPLLDAINRISFTSGETNMATAIRTMVNDQFNGANGDRSGVPDAAIILSDGAFNNPTQALSEATAAHKRGITVYSVGIGTGIVESQVQDISSPPKQKGLNYFIASSFSRLEQEVKKVLRDKICQV